MPAPTPLRRIYDGYQNLVSRLGGGLGITGSKSAGGSYVLTYPNQIEIDAAYRTSIFRKIVDIPPFDMTREWREWQAEQGQIQLIEDEERRLNLASKVRQAMTWARLYGGAGLIIGVKNSGAPNTPLDPEAVQQGGIEYVHAATRWVLKAGPIERDPMVATFGQPTDYRIAGGMRAEVIIHPSRVIRFIGPEIPDNTGVLDGWGDSLWLSLSTAVMNSDSTLAGIAELIQEAKLDIIKIPDLMEKLGTAAYETQLMNRLNSANTMKSINNFLLLDTLEEWDHREMGFAALPDVARLFLAVMSSLADIPATRLLGKSPDGMNATGDSDTRNYYDMLKSRQALELRPALAPLDEALIRSALGIRPPEITYAWGPLWQMTPSEKAAVDKTNAEIVTAYAATGLIPDTALATAVANKLIEDEVFPGIDQALADAEAAGELPTLLTAPSPAEIALAAAQNPPPAANNNANNNPPPQGKPSKLAATDSTPRSLYVRRDVVNAKEIVAWARAQGFGPIIPAEQMHVTIAFSRQPVDWVKVGSDAWGQDEKGRVTIPPGGPRVVEPLGPKGAPVLMFASSTLAWRWRSIMEGGASWEYGDNYQPHITISYEETALDLETVEPYRGEIVLGPEIFEEVNDDWQATFTEETT